MTCACTRARCLTPLPACCFSLARQAPWHGDLWTRVMDAQHKKRAEYERSVEMARKREEEIRQGELLSYPTLYHVPTRL